MKWIPDIAVLPFKNPKTDAVRLYVHNIMDLNIPQFFLCIVLFKLRVEPVVDHLLPVYYGCYRDSDRCGLRFHSEGFPPIFHDARILYFIAMKLGVALVFLC